MRATRHQKQSKANDPLLPPHHRHHVRRSIGLSDSPERYRGWERDLGCVGVVRWCSDRYFLSGFGLRGLRAAQNPVPPPARWRAGSIRRSIYQVLDVRPGAPSAAFSDVLDVQPGAPLAICDIVLDVQPGVPSMAFVMSCLTFNPV